MKGEEYAALYQLQDEALQLVFSEPSGFYLTGGTALSRFYLDHRYSDDLDFFSHELHQFPELFRLLFEKIRNKWELTELEVDARDFKRLRVSTQTASLKIDFVADRVPRIGLPVLHKGFYIDTVRNILGNKICAALGRDEARDISDLIYIARSRTFDWPAILEEAKAKESFSREELIFRLESFPTELLESVPFKQNPDLAALVCDLSILCADIQKEGMNSLAQGLAPELA
jgi:predicted nucleotidyltransferase component of viral defense system